MSWLKSMQDGKQHDEKRTIYAYCLVGGHPIYTKAFGTLAGKDICFPHLENPLGTLGAVPSKK